MKRISNRRLSCLPKAILFDLDNTLYPYNPPHSHALEVVKAKIIRQFSIAPLDVDAAYEKARIEVKMQLQGTAASHHRLLYFQKMVEIMGLGSQPLWSLDFEQTYWSAFLNHALLFDDVKNLLDDLRLLDIPLVIVTDLTTQIQLRKLIFFGIDHYFYYVVTSEEAGVDKPNRVPFEIALKKLGNPKGDIWMVGDDVQKDIVGAKEAIEAVTIQKLDNALLRQEHLASCDFAFREFSAFRQFINKLNENTKIENHELETVSH